MSVLLFADVSDGTLNMDATAKAMTAARMLGDVTVLCAGASASEAAQQASRLDGAAKAPMMASPRIRGTHRALPMAGWMRSAETRSRSSKER